MIAWNKSLWHTHSCFWRHKIYASVCHHSAIVDVTIKQTCYALHITFKMRFCFIRLFFEEKYKQRKRSPLVMFHNDLTRTTQFSNHFHFTDFWGFSQLGHVPTQLYYIPYQRKNKEGTHRYIGGHESHFGKKQGYISTWQKSKHRIQYRIKYQTRDKI